jgi:Homeodomain-like domain-containing protein
MVLRARQSRDEDEQAVIHRLSRARKAPRDVVMRARMIELSWAGQRVPAIADELSCSQKTVRRWLHRFNRAGLEGLEDLGGQGRKRRITEAERSRIIALVNTTPPGKLEMQPYGGGVDVGLPCRRGPAAGDRGEPIPGPPDPAGRRRTLAPHPLLDPLEGPGLRPKRTRIIGLYTHPPDGATVVCADELGPVIPRAFPPAPGWSPDGHRIKNESASCGRRRARRGHGPCGARCCLLPRLPGAAGRGVCGAGRRVRC